MSEACLKTENLAVGYDRVPLIEHIGFSLDPGQILAIIGPNGAGKSTILKTLIGELCPVGGAVILNGKSLSELSGEGRAKYMASVRTNRAATEYLTVRDVVSLGRYPYTDLMGILSNADRKIVQDTMEELQITDLADRDFEHLSDGQKQRVLLARALCQQPKVLVLDEPTSFLDIRYQLELVSTLRRMADTDGLTVILSIHEIELAGSFADRILCVKNGAIVRTGTPEEIFTPGFIGELFDIPKGVSRNLRKLPDNGIPKEKEENPDAHYVVAEGKKLRCGFTTGTCAALAAQACVRRLLTGSWPKTVCLVTPKGWPVEIMPEAMEAGVGFARCAVRKDGGDDVDKTHGLQIFAQVTLTETSGITIDGGEGVGRVTKPGLDQPVGEAAINSVPRKMIRETAEEICRLADYHGGLNIVIYAPEGAETAKHTFNPMLGIEGGISILGTSGVVEPMSVQALIDTIQVELRQARAQGFDTVLLTPGKYGVDFLRSQNLQPPELPVVRVSNYIGDALDCCGLLGFREVLLVGHIGKLIKLAGGIMNTHSRTADCRTELFCAHAALCGGDSTLCAALYNCATTDACLEMLEQAGLRGKVMQSITAAVQRHLDHRADGKCRVGALIFSNIYGELGRTETAEEMIEQWNSQK